MKRVSIINILQENIIVNSKIIIHGWVKTRRDSKIGISFLNINDGSCFKSIQVVVPNNLKNYKEDILRLTSGCSVSIIGKIVKSEGKNQKYEVMADIVNVTGWVNNPENYPISSKRHSLEYLREVAHLRPRTNLIGAISRFRHFIAKTIHNFMDNQKFIWIPTPIITSIDTEGISKMFKVSTLDSQNLIYKSSKKNIYNKDFFGKSAFLTVSGQLNIESYACSLSRVYTFGPTFRAENSNTNRHLAEFWMLEPEIAFATLDDIIKFSDKMLKYVFKEILINYSDDVRFFYSNIDKRIFERLEKFINSDIIQIDYTKAINILQQSNQKFKNDVYWGIRLSLEHEKFLTEKYFCSPIVVKNYPRDNKAFYMRINDDEKTVAAMDILFPVIGEIIGGSQREERLDKLDSNLEKFRLNKEDYWWYRDLRKYGTVPHSGFGLGFERLILYITGIKNIRDVVPFPRYSNNINF